MPDKDSQEKESAFKREFMREKIVKPPVSKKRIAVRFAVYLCFAVLFGVIAAVSFVIAKPLAGRYLGTEETVESEPIQFTRDEPETQPVTEATEETPVEVEPEQLEAAVAEALETYAFSAANLNSIYNGLRDIAVQADRGIVRIRSGRQQTDLFGNPVENTGSYAGAVIAKGSGEFVIFTCAEAVRQADSVKVAFYDGTEATGEIRQVDEVLNMAVVTVRLSELSSQLREQTVVLPLGNSYSVHTGDMMVGVGAPAGMVHSMTYGPISYVARNVQLTDASVRLFYVDAASSAQAGTFFLNTAGELIGWASEEYEAEDALQTAVIGISDYKSVLEKMTNGVEAPYFGVRGQEVSESMAEEGIPKGVYVTEAVSGSPAYDAGIQNGDIIVQFGEKEIVTFRELQMQIENTLSGASVSVRVMRRGRDGYTELDFYVNIRAR